MAQKGFEVKWTYFSQDTTITDVHMIFVLEAAQLYIQVTGLDKSSQ